MNELPLPVKIRLPDIPLPSAKKMLKMMARNSGGGGKNSKTSEDFITPGEITPASTPAQDRTYTDDELLR